MAINHLSDDQIQEFLDYHKEQPETEIATHLKTCPACVRKMELYNQLFTELANDQTPQLSKNFALKIINLLDSKKEKKQQWIETALLVILFNIGLAASFYFLNPFPLLQKTGNSVITAIGSFFKWFSASVDLNIFLLVSIIIILLAVEIVDRKILRPKLR